MNYTDTFGSSTLPPSEYGYQSLSITVDTTLVWPYNSDSTSTVVSKIINLSCDPGNSVTLPDATQVSTSEDFLIRNVGANSLTVKDSSGATVATVASGAASYFYLTNNSTAAGVFGVIGFGVGTSTADAASLVGYGIKAIGNTLNQSHPVVPTASSITVDDSHRSKLVVFTGGSGTFDLTTATTLGDDFFVLIRNDGTGTLTIDPSASETVDGLSTLQIQPAESLILLCTGTLWYSVGYGRSVIYNFTQLTKDISVGGTITLTAAEASNKLITFIGNPSGAVTVVVPSVVAVYYTYSNISTAQTITFKTSAGSGVGISQGARIIALCDGTNVLSAQSAVANSSLSLTDGIVSAPSLYFATQTNTGLYKYGTNGLGFSVNGVSKIRVTPTTAEIDGLAASSVVNTPAGNIAATTVQAAINELDTEKSPVGHTHTGVYQPASATLDEYAAVDPTAAGLALLDDVDTAAQRVTLGLVIGADVQGYDVDTAKTDVAQNFTLPQRSAPLTDNDLSFDLSAKQNFSCTWTGAGTLTFTNIASAAGQSGWIKFVQSGSGTVAAAANSKISAANLTKLGTAGTYIASYYCDGTDVYVGIGVYA